MWEPLDNNKKVQEGDKLRCTHKQSEAAGVAEFEVTKSDRHYFEIAPLKGERAVNNGRRIIRYFDIGYYFIIDIWVADEDREGAATLA